MARRSGVVDTRPFTKETAPILGQPAPIPIASREQSNIVTQHTQSSIHSEQSVATTAGTLLVYFVCGASKAHLAGRNDGGKSTSKMEDVDLHGDHAERVDGGVEQTIHLQHHTQILLDADTDTTRYASPSLEVNRMVSSSKRSETSSEPRSTERSDRVPVNERQLDLVSGVRTSEAASVDDATIVQKSVPSVRSGYATPRKTATVDSSESRTAPDTTRATTVYNVVGVERDRTVVGVVGRCVM